MGRRRKLLARGILALASLAALDVALARTWLADGRLGARPLPPFGALSSDAQRAALARMESGEREPDRLTVFDRELGWRVEPGASRGGRFHIGRLGTRGTREYADRPPPGVLRLACYGDSFTFGDEVRDEWTFEAFLESLDARVEALNLGVPAYGTDQALLRMRRDGLFGARVAVLGLLLENVGRNVNRYRTLWAPHTETPLAKPRFVLEDGELRLVPQPFASAGELARAVRDGSILGRLGEHEHWVGRPQLATGEWSALGRLIGGWIAYRERSPERLWLERDGEPRRVTLALVEAFREEALARGAERALVLVLPMKAELARYRASGRAYWAGLLHELAERGVDHLDLAPALAREEDRLEAERAASGADGGPTLWVAAHLSSVGNLVIARELLARLSAEGLVDAR